MSINPVNLFMPGTKTNGFSSMSSPAGGSEFSLILSHLREKPPSPEEVMALASYLEWRMKAVLVGLVGDNNPSPLPIFMTSPAQSAESKTDLEAVIAQAARDNQLDPALIRAVIQTESAGNPRAVSPKGAMGLMQLMPETARSLGVKDPFDIRENVHAGSRYLKSLIDRYNGNVELALAAYNWGPGNLERSTKSMPQETVQYINKVKRYWRVVG